MHKVGDVVYAHMLIGMQEVGSVTLAAYFNGADWDVGVAFCSPRDQFSRARGRKIALGRAQVGAGPGFDFVSHDDEKLPIQLRRHFAKWVATAGTQLPQWLRRGLGVYIAPRSHVMWEQTVYVSFE